MINFWKNKKVIAYIALAHHTRFIIPVMEELESRGAVVKYIVAQAERSQEITAIELGLPYSHIFDYVREKDRKEIMKNYEGMKHTLSDSLKHEFFMGVLPVTVTDKTLLSSAFEYTGFNNLFEQEKPDLCFALHEINRWGKMLAFWAKKHNVPFISLQEGLSYGLDFGLSGHAQYSTLNLVWGERIRHKLISFDAPAAKIIPVGNTHLSKELEIQAQNRVRQTKRADYKIEKAFITLLILSSRLPVPDLFYPIFKTVSQSPTQKIFVKFHPATKKPHMDAWVAKITAKFKQNSYFIHGEEKTYDLISMADVVVLGQKSTTGLETLAFGKPLVKLDFAYISNAPYSFVDQGVAVKMRAEQLAQALENQTDFSGLMDKKKVKDYLKYELADTRTAVQTVCSLFKKTIQASTTKDRPIPVDEQSGEKQWTFINHIPENPELFLAQLEALAVNSSEGGSYEIFFLLPKIISPRIQAILDTLEGDIQWIRPDQNPIPAVNQALKKASGEYFIFFAPNIAPLSGWLKQLAQQTAALGPEKLFGARITDKAGKIVHAGLVIDYNNTPISAYAGLDINFAPALTQRPFQMVDHFLAVSQKMFFKAGGFTKKAGQYKFMDFCLKARAVSGQANPVTYLPKVQLIFLDTVPKKSNQDDSIYFLSKWHGALWESQEALQKEDGLSAQALDHARLSSAMKAFR